jgi:predicted benzoate:H+ symporter BenE
MAVDLTRIGKLHVGLLGATGAVAYTTRWVEPGSLLLGGAVMGLNFWLLRWISALLQPDALDPAKRGRAALAVAAFVLKFGLFIGLLAALFWHLPIEGLSFALGVTLLLVACVIEAARQDVSAVKGAG